MSTKFRLQVAIGSLIHIDVERLSLKYCGTYRKQCN